MVTYTSTIGSVAGGNAYDGDYATLGLWVTASGNFQHPDITDGDTLEAVLIDGLHYNGISTGWPGFSRTHDYTILVRGENSHEGSWSGAPLSGEPGACITQKDTGVWHQFGDQNLNIIFRDFVFISSGGTLYIGNQNATSGDSGNYSSLVEHDRVMFTHDESYASGLYTWQVPPFMSPYTANESRNPSTGEVSAVGKWTFNFKNCVFETGASRTIRQITNNNRQQVELEINLIGTIVHTNTSATTSDFWHLAATDFTTQYTSGALDSILRVNMSGCIFDKFPLEGGPIRQYWGGADKTINITDCLFEGDESSFNSELQDSYSATQPGFSAFSRTYTNVNFDTSFTYTGASAPNSVSYATNSQYGYEGDYRQVDGSLAIDYVTNATMPSVDVTNTNRGISPFDAGAFEFNINSGGSDVTAAFGNVYVRLY